MSEEIEAQLETETAQTLHAMAFIRTLNVGDGEDITCACGDDYPAAICGLHWPFKDVFPEAIQYLLHRGTVLAAMEERADAGDEIRHLLQTLMDAPHIITFNASDWDLLHPLGCRPYLTRCKVHKAVMEYVAGGPPEDQGRFLVSLLPGGDLWIDGPAPGGDAVWEKLLTLL